MGGNAAAENESGDPCFGAGVEQVKIESASETHVSFSTRCASQTGDLDECLLRTFTVPLAEVYTAPIKDIQQVELVKGAIGTLVLSRAGWATRSADGSQIFGGDRALFKEPKCAAMTRLLTNLVVVPTSITVRGHVEGDSEFFDLELIGPDAAEAQDIGWNGADYIDLRLTSRGARRLGLRPRTATARIWPVRIRVTGAPVIDPSVTGEVDLLSIEMADRLQAFAYAKQGAPVKLVLSQDGVNAFHVTPQLVAELSGETAKLVGTCHGCAQNGRDHARRRATRASRASRASQASRRRTA
jgi:hypothetical protein